MKLVKILLLLFIASFVYAEDVTIDQAIDIAIQNSPKVKYYREQVSQAKDTVGLAYAYLNPTLTGDIDYIFQNAKKKNYDSVTASRTSETGVTLRMPIDIGGQTHTLIQGAKSMYSSSELGLNNGLFDVIKEVKQDYLMCLLYRENINTAKSALALSEDYLDKVKKEVEAGTKAKFDITRQEYDLAERKTRLITAQNNYDEMINTFNLSLGLENNFVTPISLENVNIASINDLQIDFLQIAFENRTDLKKALQDLETAKLALVNQKKSNNPTLDVHARYAYMIENQLNYDSRNNWEAGADLTVPFFDGGIQSANVKIYQSKVDEQQNVVNDTKQNIINGVMNSKLSATSSLSKVDQCLSGVVLAKEAYDIAKLRYEQNLGTYLDVSTALDSLVQAQDALSTSKYTYAISMVTLEREIGATEKIDEYTNAIIIDVVNKKKAEKKATKETAKGDTNEK